MHQLSSPEKERWRELDDTVPQDAFADLSHCEIYQKGYSVYGMDINSQFGKKTDPLKPASFAEGERVRVKFSGRWYNAFVVTLWQKKKQKG